MDLSGMKNPPTPRPDANHAHDISSKTRIQKESNLGTMAAMSSTVTGTSRAEIIAEVRRVLRSAAKGKGADPNYLTAYQILNRLPADLRIRLIEKYGRSGKTGGRGHGAANQIRGVLTRSLKKELDIVYFDNKGLTLLIGDETIEAGNRVCALYRISPLV
jgi:hypothetical protein